MDEISFASSAALWSISKGRSPVKLKQENLPPIFLGCSNILNFFFLAKLERVESLFSVITKILLLDLMLPL